MSSEIYDGLNATKKNIIAVNKSIFLTNLLKIQNSFQLFFIQNNYFGTLFFLFKFAKIKIKKLKINTIAITENGYIFVS